MMRMNDDIFILLCGVGLLLAGVAVLVARAAWGIP